MDETLTIENLGPIKKLEIKPRPLTIIIGEQASGKSLVAQLLYFFRGFKSHLAQFFGPDLVSQANWPNLVVGLILNSLRGVDFGHFANRTAHLNYQRREIGTGWRLEINQYGNSVRVFDDFAQYIYGRMGLWQNDPAALGDAQANNNIFIPTERGLVSMLLDSHPGWLYATSQPKPFREFAELLSTLPQRRRLSKISTATSSFISQCQKDALGGKTFFTQDSPRKIMWSADSKLLPIAGTSSGQMEAWPFFEIAQYVSASDTCVNVYFEEPETHLHPRAQVEIMNVVAYLVNRGHNFVITTHSPFLLQVIDNMLQRFMNFKGQVPEEQEKWLNPEKVAAYCLRRDSEESPEDIMDRKETGLLDASELEKVSNELGAEFDDLLYGAE